MGSGTFNPSAYRSFSASTARKTTDEIYKSGSLDKDLNPRGVKIRESRDSVDNPQSTPLIVALDVTGSMGILADVIARKGLGTLFTEILARKPITDPHLMFMAVGDASYDEAPLQVSQFEADNRIVDQLTKIWLEHGGGGNDSESYNFPWYFAANHTVHDSLIKRGKRGYLFTVGDECAPERLTSDQIQKFIGDRPEREIPNGEMLQDAQRMYDVFHIIISESDYARHHAAQVMDTWSKLLGQHVIRLADHKKLAETIESTIEVVEGRNAEKVTAKFGSTVYDAVKHLPPGRGPKPLALKA
jgi:hypothetical protein